MWPCRRYSVMLHFLGLFRFRQVTTLWKMKFQFSRLVLKISLDLLLKKADETEMFLYNVKKVFRTVMRLINLIYFLEVRQVDADLMCSD